VGRPSKSVAWSRNFQMGMYVAGKCVAAKKVKQYKEYLNCDYRSFPD
jgi:hypothetical protein